jgi:hypothetical protein
VSGVEVPRLGSLKDKILRDYLIKKSSREIAKNRVFTLGIIGILGALQAPKEAVNNLVSNWENYVNLELFMEGAKEHQEVEMMQEYETLWKHVRPKLNIMKDENGRNITSLSIESLKPKIEA